MKQSVSLIACLLIASGMQLLNAQQEASMSTTPLETVQSNQIEQTSSEKESHYTFIFYAAASKSETAFEEQHTLCSSLNDSWNAFNENYRRINKVSSGFSGQVVEIYKPAIYNAVVKADKYVCKAVKKGDIPKEEAIALLKHILDCANALASENDTKMFEKEIAGAKTPESIIRIFNHVELEYV